MRVAPFTQTIPVWNYEDRTTRVRVAPYVKEVAAYNYEDRVSRVRVPAGFKSVAVFNYENRVSRVRVAPYVKEVAVYNYRTYTSCPPTDRGCPPRRVRVAPFTQTIPVWNYKETTKRVRVGPFTKLVAVYRLEERTTKVRVAPFTQSIPVWNYKETTKRVRVAPYVKEVDVHNYQTRTRPVAHTHPTTTTTTTMTTAAPVVRPVVSVSVYLFDSVSEGSPARFVVTVAPAPEQPYDVAVSVSSKGGFGVRSGVRTVTVPTSGRYFLDVATIDDDQTEPDGTINVRAVPNSRYTIKAGTATVTVKDNDIQILQPPTTPTTTTTTTTTVPPRPPSPVPLAAPTDVDVSCAAGRLVVVWATALSSSVQRGFEIQVDGEAVTVPYAVGLSSLEWIWGEPESGKPYRVRVRERVFSVAGDGAVDVRFSPWVSSSVTCERFVPQDFEASCNAHGVVEARWDPVNGASLYQVEWLPQHETGSNERRNVITTNPTWQGDEGGTYKLRVSAYSKAAKKWSGFSPQETVTCPELEHPFRWTSISESYSDSALSSNGYILTSRTCSSVQNPIVTSERICSEVWYESMVIRIDGRSWWKNLPLRDWDNPYNIVLNGVTLYSLVSGLRAAILAGKILQQAVVNFRIAGISQVAGALEVTKDGSVSIFVNSNSSVPASRACLPPRYLQKSIVYPRVTESSQGHITHRDATICYCASRG